MLRKVTLRCCWVAVGALLILPAVAQADLTLLKPDASGPVTFTGTGGYSADGLGQERVGGTVQADVPAGSSVVRAYLYGTYFLLRASPDIAQRTINFDGRNVVLAPIAENFATELATARADVTSQVAAKVGTGGAITNFAVNNDPSNLDGVALVVIFSNDRLPYTSIAVFDGSANVAGDTATFPLPAPIDKNLPNFSAVMSLGIGFSFQTAQPPPHRCSNAPGGQYSIVKVNGKLLTNCAGNFDDGDAPFDGALITVGGIGDSTDNPTPPEAPPTDDELYNLAPFLTQGDTSVTLATSNPSHDDNLFLAVMAITVRRPLPTSKDQCKNNGWRDFGVFKNQGDCVSFVATGGRNQPAGPPR